MNLLTHNWHMKALAVLSALVLWFFVVGIENAVHLLPGEIQVKAINIGKNVGLATTLPQVKIYLKATENVKNISNNNFEATIDLDGKSPGEYDLNVQIKSDNSQVTVIKVIPEKIHVKVASLAEKEVPITVLTTGKPMVGYTLKEVVLETTKAKISGAQNLLDLISEVKASVILDGTETGEVRKNITLAVGENVAVPKESISIDPDQVMAVAHIESEFKNKTVKIVPVLSGTGDLKALAKSIVVSPSTVDITGDSKILESLTEIKTEPVDSKDLLSRNIPLEVNLVLPANITLVNANTKFTVAIGDEQETKFLMAPIKITRESGNFKVKDITPSEIKVTVVGPIKLVEALNGENISVNLNLDGMAVAGTVPINIKDIIIPAGIGITDFTPAEVEVTAV